MAEGSTDTIPQAFYDNPRRWQVGKHGSEYNLTEHSSGGLDWERLRREHDEDVCPENQARGIARATEMTTRRR